MARTKGSKNKKKKGIIINCNNCNKEVYAETSRIVRKKFCSMSCRTSFNRRGKKNTIISNEKNRLSHLGRKYTFEHCKAISEALKGKSNGRFGEKHPFWIKDRSLLKDDHRNRGGQLHREWSNDVKKRDNFKCRINNQDCEGRIEAHHILGWTEYPELRYEINNGITLCHAHHPRKRAEEKLLIPEFQRLVEVSLSN